MKAGPFPFALKVVLAALIVWLQAFSLAHAAEHGDEPHEHDGVECELTLFTSEDTVILPSGVASDFAPPTPAIQVRDFGTLDTRTWPPERGPPPRGPPSHKQ